jgi:DNA-binding LytR/AlgR family response regulator
MKAIRFYVMEDVPDFLKEVINALEESEGCEVVGSSDTVSIGYADILSLKPDALLLDIQLFGGSAFDLVRMLRANGEPVPPIVIMTGNVQFEAAKEAVDACGSALVSIIGKPFWSNWKNEFPSIKATILSRLYQAHEYDDLDATVSINEAREVLFIRSNQMTHRFLIADIIYLEVGGEGQTYFIMLDGRKTLVRKTLNVLMGLMPEYIVRINRFHAVNIHKMLYINHEDGTMALEGMSKNIDIGDTYMQDLKTLFS